MASLLSLDPELAHPRVSLLRTLDPLLPCQPMPVLQPCSPVLRCGALWGCWHTHGPCLSGGWSSGSLALLPSVLSSLSYSQSAHSNSRCSFHCPHTQLYPPCPGQKDDPSWTLYPLLALLLWLMSSGFLHDWTPPCCQQTSSRSDLMALPKDWGIVTSSYSTTIYSPASISQHAVLHITHSGFGTHLRAPQTHHLFSQFHTSVHAPPSISPPRSPHALSLAPFPFATKIFLVPPKQN